MLQPANRHRLRQIHQTVGPDNNRNREFDRALEILERTCECSNDKMLLPDGKLGSTCQECQDLDARNGAGGRDESTTGRRPALRYSSNYRPLHDRPTKQKQTNHVPAVRSMVN